MRTGELIRSLRKQVRELDRRVRECESANRALRERNRLLARESSQWSASLSLVEQERADAQRRVLVLEGALATWERGEVALVDGRPAVVRAPVEHPNDPKLGPLQPTGAPSIQTRVAARGKR